MRAALRKHTELMGATLWASAPGGVKVINLHMRQTKCYCDVADAAINSDGSRALGKFVRQGIKPQHR